MAERRVGAREANQQFSALLASTERNGETIIITRRGKAVARLTPEPEPVDERAADEMAAIIDLYSRPMGGKSFSRETLYDRGDE